MKKIFLLLSFSFSILTVYSEEIPFKEGEVLKYDISFKWGVMMKAGTANYTVHKGTYESIPTYKTSLDFKTSSFFDGIFKIRDTLTSHAGTNLKPLYHIRKIHEGRTRFWEEVFFKDHRANYTQARVRRENVEMVKFDTILISNRPSYDLLNIFIFARTLDYPKLTPGQMFHISSFIGKDNVNITVHFKGQSVIEKSPSVKYKAYRLLIDIRDIVFDEPKSAMEIWISDDENRVPLRLKAKLKIGAAEANLSSWQNLKYPFTSEIKIPGH